MGLPETVRVWIAIAALLCSSSAEPADVARGQALFTTCAGCHGNHAEGRPAMHAPNLTGLGSDYLVQQLRKFRAAHRGNTSDTYGFMMIGRANALPDDNGLQDVAAFIDSLPVKPSSGASVAGKVERGRSLYGACAGCHGANAEGTGSLRAPSLRQQDAAYLSLQMQHFSSGVRGADPEDIEGKQMRAAAKALPDLQAVEDVIAYIKTR